MTEISTHIINCNKYKLKLQIKKFSNWVKKQDSIVNCLKETLKSKRHRKIENKRLKKYEPKEK